MDEVALTVVSGAAGLSQYWRGSWYILEGGSVPPTVTFTAWMPLSCRLNSMNEASMSYELVLAVPE